MLGTCIRLDCQNEIDSNENKIGLCDRCREIVIKELVLGNEKPSEVRRRLTEELGIEIDQVALAKLIDSLAQKMTRVERSEFLRVVANREIMIISNENEVQRLFPGATVARLVPRKP